MTVNNTTGIPSVVRVKKLTRKTNNIKNLDCTTARGIIQHRIVCSV